MASEPRKPCRSFFVTGTDTEVGKTFASTVLLHTLVQRHAQAGLRIVGMKPVAAGLVQHGGRWVAEDAMALRAASNVAVPDDLDNPVRLPDPLSPHLAAERAGRRVSVAELQATHAALSQHADIVLVEGAGGWRVPLNETEYLSDLARALQLPVVLVVGLRLGCLNHALLTAEAVRADGLQLAGWVANRIDPAMACADENIATLQARLGAPLLGVLPWQAEPDAHALARQGLLQAPAGF